MRLRPPDPPAVLRRPTTHVLPRAAPWLDVRGAATRPRVVPYPGKPARQRLRPALRRAGPHQHARRLGSVQRCTDGLALLHLPLARVGQPRALRYRTQSPVCRGEAARATARAPPGRAHWVRCARGPATERHEEKATQCGLWRRRGSTERGTRESTGRAADRRDGGSVRGRAHRRPQDRTRGWHCATATATTARGSCPRSHCQNCRLSQRGRQLRTPTASRVGANSATAAQAFGRRDETGGAARARSRRQGRPPLPLPPPAGRGPHAPRGPCQAGPKWARRRRGAVAARCAERRAGRGERTGPHLRRVRGRDAPLGASVPPVASS